MTRVKRIYLLESIITNLRAVGYSMECDLKEAKRLVERMDATMDSFKRQIADWDEEIKDLRKKIKCQNTST